MANCDYINVRIHKDTLLKALCDRVDYWLDSHIDRNEAKVYKKYYKDCINNNVFECAIFNPLEIVDNDIPNYTFLYKNDLSKKQFETLKELYENGETCTKDVLEYETEILTFDEEQEIFLIR